MSQLRFDDSLWFVHQNGTRFYPWFRQSGHHGHSAFWVSDGSNLIENADPINTVQGLIIEVFGRNRSIWLRSGETPALTGLYRLGEQAISDWGSHPSLKPLIQAALSGATLPPAMSSAAVGANSSTTREISPTELVAAMEAEAARLDITEREALVKQRIGQDLFRDALLHLWQRKCAVTGLDIPELLRASHAKPWKDCATNEERLDPFNGLLLAPHLDLLFDRGFLSFDDHGHPLWSQAMTLEASTIMGLDGLELRLRVDSRHLPYLQYHREMIFRHPSSPTSDAVPVGSAALAIEQLKTEQS